MEIYQQKYCLNKLKQYLITLKETAKKEQKQPHTTFKLSFSMDDKLKYSRIVALNSFSN